VTPFTKFTCAFVLAGALAAPAYADSTNGGVAPSDASPKASATQSGQTAANSQGQAGGQNSTANNEGSMNNGQSSMNNGQPGMAGARNPMQLSQKLRSDLSKAGFTDITVMATSFLVRAKDSEGNPIMMVINPDSITAITESGGNANSNSASNSNRNTSSSAGATPGPSSTGGSQPVTPGNGKQP